MGVALGSCVGVVGDGLGRLPPDASEWPGLLAPARATFEPVADVLQGSCGTLDCHGQIGRNLRLYGGRGLRWDPRDNSADNPTTAREYDESYWSVIGLEPEVMSAVVRDHGLDPQRLTMVRKARGLEKHKGGLLFETGDDQDRCLVSWVGGAIDRAACDRVLHPAREANAASGHPSMGPVGPADAVRDSQEEARW